MTETNIDLLSNKLLNIIENNPGIKATELIIEVDSIFYKNGFNHKIFQNIIKDLFDKKLIKEVEYIDKDMSYRIKSKYYKI